MDQNSSINDRMPSDFGEFSHAKQDAITSQKKKQKKRRLQSASIKVVNSHISSSRIHKD